MSTDTHTAVYTVEGMTCGHCVSSVTEEVSDVAGVSTVDVDLATGRLTVTSAASVDADLIRAAVTEAGYRLASSDETGSAAGAGAPQP